MSSFISAAPVASGQMQSLDGLRAHSLPSDAVVLVSPSLVTPTNQNPGSYAIVESGVNSLGVTTTGSVPAVTQSPFADLYKEGSVYFSGAAGNFLTNTATYSNTTIQWNTTGMTVEAWVNYPTFTGAASLATTPIPTLFGLMSAAGSTNQWSFGANTTGYVNFYYFNGNYQTVMSTTQLSTNTWNHIAMTCTTSGQIFIFVNGIQTTVVANRNATLVTPATNFETVQGTPVVNQSPELTLGRYNGVACTAYVADIRLTTGTPVYTGSTGSLATFTVPSAPLNSTTSPGVTQFLLRAGQNSPTIQNGALTFDRGLRQFMNFGPQTFNIVTQGFTAVWRGQMNGTVAAYERLFEFGTGTTTGNILALRSVATNQINFIIYSSTGGYSGSATSTSVSQGVNYVLTFRYNPVTQLADVWVNGVPGTPVTITIANLIADRTVALTYLSKASDSTQNGNFTSNTFAVYNRALSNVEIYNSYLALTTTPATPLQKTLEIGDINGTPALSVAGDGKVFMDSVGLTSNVLPWPPAAMTGYDTVINGGVYKARSSTEFSPVGSGYPYAWYAFDKNTSNYWVSVGAGYNTSIPYNYTGAVTTTDVNGTLYPGEWLQVQLPNPITLSSYTAVFNSWTSAAPSTWVILGSSDGVNWTLVDSRAGQSYSSATQTFTLSTAPVQSFNYFRFVTRNVTGTGGYVQIYELYYYGTADTSPALTIAPATVFNTSVATPSLTGVAGSGFVPQDFSSSGLNIPAYVVSNTATAANTVAYSSFGPFAGEGSLYFPGGTGAHVNLGTGTGATYNYGLGESTIEAWAYFIPNGATRAIINRSGGQPFGISVTSDHKVFVTFGGFSPPLYTTAAVVPQNTWCHIALTFSSSIVRIFINGVMETVAVTGTGTYTSDSPTYIGQSANLLSAMHGYLANLRITRGQALYTAAFTPPTAPLQPIQGVTQAGLPYGTVLLLRNAPAPGRIQTTKFSGANSGQVLAFPPAAMTSYATTLNAGYGQGTYVASASQEYSSSTYAWYAFDKNASTGWASYNASYSGSLPYGVAAGGSTTVDANGNLYPGEWLQIQKAVPVIISSYSITSTSNYNFKFPAKWWVLGSRDGFTWYLVNSQSGQTSTSSGQVQTWQVTSAQSFNFYRIVINQINGSGTICEFGEWTLNGSIESVNVTPDGRVGLGVVNPTRALEVAGDIVCSGTVSSGTGGMFRNALYNGDMRISQRGASFVNPSSVYTLDRWYIANQGAVGNGTISQIQSGLTNFSNALQLATTSTLSGNWMISQSLETRDIVRFQGQPVTVSFWYRVPTNFTQIWNSSLWWTTSTDTKITNGVSPSPNTAGSGSMPNTTQWRYTQFQAFVPLTAQALSIGFETYNNVVNGATIQITGVQLEKGTVATPFEVRPYATELALCQRYYEQSYAAGTAPGTNTNIGLALFYGASDASSNFDFAQRYSVPKRMIISPTFYLNTGTIGSWNYNRNGASTTATVSGASTYSTEQYWGAYVNVGAAWVPCNVYGHWVANAEL